MKTKPRIEEFTIFEPFIEDCAQLSAVTFEVDNAANVVTIYGHSDDTGKDVDGEYFPVERVSREKARERYRKLIKWGFVTESTR